MKPIKPIEPMEPVLALSPSRPVADSPFQFLPRTKIASTNGTNPTNKTNQT
jgi:hypothetical protein